MTDSKTRTAPRRLSEAELTTVVGGIDRRGGAGDDILIGGAGNDVLLGGEGNDTVIVRPGEGADRAMGEGGTDALCLEAAPDAYQIAFTSGGFDPNGNGQQLLPGSAGIVTFATGGTVTFSDFERITHL